MVGITEEQKSVLIEAVSVVCREDNTADESMKFLQRYGYFCMSGHLTAVYRPDPPRIGR